MKEFERWLEEQIAIEQDSDYQPGEHPRSKVTGTDLNCASDGLKIALAELRRRLRLGN